MGIVVGELCWDTLQHAPTQRKKKGDPTISDGPYTLPVARCRVRLREVRQREPVIMKTSGEPNLSFRYFAEEHVAPGQWEEPCRVEVRDSDIRGRVIAF